MNNAPSIHRDQVLHIAKLAHLTLSEEEIPSVTEQLVKILDYIERLNEVDTAGIESTVQVNVEHLFLRSDELRPSLTHEAALAAAPVTVAEGFVVPAFMNE